MTMSICFSQHTSCTWSLGNLAKKWTCLQAWRLAMCQFVAVWAEKLAIGIIEKFVSQVAHTRSDQLSHSSGWKMCRKNLHIVTLAKVGATCSCTVLHKGSFKHWWWHSLQRSWHRLVDLVTDMSRHLSLICRITSKTSKWVGEPDYCSDMLRQPSSTSKMQMVHCTRAKAKKHGKTIPQTRLITKRAWKARQCMTSCVMLA